MDTRHGSPTTGAASGSATTSAANRAVVFSKMESLVREMQDTDNGIPIRSQKLFLTSVPSAFMGYDLIEWLMDRLDIEDSAEAIHLANLLCQYGYFFPTADSRSLVVKDDSTLYRFQTPYYWPSQSHSADSTDYAIYLTKRLARNKQKHGLEDYEVETYNMMKKALQHKWDFITMQADEQVKLAKDRKKGDKIVTDSQERAYWRVYRPPPGYINTLENAPVPDRGNVANRVRKKTLEERKKEVEFFNNQIERTRMKASVAVEGLITHADTYFDYDFFQVPPQPSNPWVTDDLTFWALNESIIDVPTEKRVRRWAVNFSDLVADATGLTEFTNYLRKEYCHENIRFWQAVNDLRYGPSSEIQEKVKHIYDEFLKAGAPCEINIDGKTMEVTQQMMKNPTRYSYDLAAEHVYVLLLKKDCYPRFLRSEHYKNLLANAVQPMAKKRFFGFGAGSKPKKPSTTTAPNSSSLQPAQTPQPVKRNLSDEQTIAGAGGDTDTGSGTGPSAPGSVAPCLTLALIPRVDCEPPYSFFERAASIATSEPQESKAKTTEEAKENNICPWETVDTLPRSQQSSSETSQSESKQKVQQTPKQESQRTHTQLGKVQTPSVPPNFPSKEHLSYPKIRPDRSKSVDVSTLADTKSPVSVPAIIRHPTPTSTVAISTSSVLSPCKEQPDSNQRNEKSRSVDVETYTSVNTTALTTVDTYVLTERRASEGSQILKEKTTSFILQSVSLSSTPPIEKDSTAREVPTSIGVKKIKDTSGEVEKSKEKKTSQEKIDVIINVQTSPDLPKESNRSEKTEASSSISSPLYVVTSSSNVRQLPIDYTVRSGHLPGQYCLPSSCRSSKVDASPSSPKFTTASSQVTAAAYTSTTSTSTTTMALSKEKATTDYIPLIKSFPQKPPLIPPKVQRSCEDPTSNPTATPTEVENTWEEQSVQKTTDICPWEDEENCKVDTPFVKTYATLGYL